MSSNPKADPMSNRLILWGAQLSSALIMTALAWWLPDLMPIEPIPGAIRPIMLMAVASVPLAIVTARLLGVRRRRADIVVHESRPGDAAPRRAPAGELGRYVAAVVLAELPAILGLVYVLMGGSRLHALAFGAAAILLILTLWPGRPSPAGAR